MRECNGSFESEENLDEVEFDSNVTINITADSGHQITKVWLDGAEISIQDNALEILNVQSNHKVVIIFSEITDDLELEGSISISGMSCSKNGEEGSILDFLFIIISMFGVVVPKKKFFCVCNRILCYIFNPRIRTQNFLFFN